MNIEQKVFRVPSTLLKGKVNVLLVGAGGNGSQVLSGLARLHQTMIALGHPAGLAVTVVDGDEVSEANVGRQLFYRSDVGLPKAVVLTHRVNTCFGLNWRGVHGYLSDEDGDFFQNFDVVIGCVDTRKARRVIHRLAAECWKPKLWLDLGNERFSGQVILGQTRCRRSDSDDPLRLPVVTEFYPDILDNTLDEKAEKESGPSCSLAEAVQKQALFTNQLCATQALTLLSNLFYLGELRHSAVFFNAMTGASSPLPIDPAAWARFGIERKASSTEKGAKLAA